VNNTPNIIKNKNIFIKNTAIIVAHYVTNHEILASALPAVIQDVFDTLKSLGEDLERPTVAEPAHHGPQMPAVDPTQSIFPSYLICLEDGKRVAMLKRHLRMHYNMTPGQYRAKWGLPPSYPMVSENLAKLRSKVAKQRQKWIVSYRAV
jgi:predicted transcriptional regulator